MSDIVDRLRRLVDATDRQPIDDLMDEAADEIERLRNGVTAAISQEEREAVLLAIKCLHDQPHTAMHQTVLRAARDLRKLLDRTE